MTLFAILSAIAALAAVLLFIVLGGWLLRSARLLRPGLAGRLRIEHSLTIDPRRRLLLVSCDGRELLLLTGTQDQVVGWLPKT